MTAHNHDLDPSCPEVTMPDGSVRGACMDQAQIVSTGNERDDRITITVDEEGSPDGYTMVSADMRHACGQTHSSAKVVRTSDLYPNNVNRAKRAVRDDVLRAAKDCEMGTGTTDPDGMDR